MLCEERGDHERALALFDRAEKLLSQRLVNVQAKASVAIALVNTGKEAEARMHMLGSFGGYSSYTALGDFARTQALEAAFYAECACDTGFERFSDDELHSLVLGALKLTSSGILLGLMAWAYAQREWVEQSRHLNEEADDRIEDRARLSSRFPLLEKWMAGTVARPRSDEPPLTRIEQARELLSHCRYQEDAERSYDAMRGGFMWNDELPDRELDRQRALRAHFMLVQVIAYRGSLTRGEPDEKLSSDWRRLKELVPQWPGFRRERIYGNKLKADLQSFDDQLGDVLAEVEKRCDGNDSS